MAIAQIIPQPMQQTRREPEDLPAMTELRPAQFARYGALQTLRYDYPLVLVDGDNDTDLLRPLSRVIDEALRLAAPKGLDGEPLRQQILRLEQRMRDRVAQGHEEKLTDLWRTCASELLAESGEAPFGAVDQSYDNVRQAIKVDGKVIGCHGATPRRVLGHIWQAMHKTRARKFRNKVDGLLLRLNDILKSDHMKSDEAHSANALAAAMGTDNDGSIDFTALSQILERARPQDRLPQSRVARIRHAMNVLQTQAFFGPGRTSFLEAGQAICYSYVFKSCTEALEAYRDRLPSLVAFTKALTIAELEVENKYVPELHDAIFDAFDESDLTSEQMELLPPAMIFLRDGITGSAEISRAFEALACGLPIKVMVQVDDILGPTSPEPPINSFGAGSARLAAMAMGLNNAFVMQSTSAHLYRMRGALMRGMQYAGPAMFSLYSGATQTMPGVEPYILAAAATEARAFASFTYDPSAGENWAARFDIADNPRNETNWPSYELTYETAAGERLAESLPFTFGDFAICDTRYRRFCHKVPRSEWSADMVPFGEWLTSDPNSELVEKPFVMAIDEEDRLYRVALDNKIASAARRCADAWCRLQELAGINNSHVKVAMAEERKRREAMLMELSAAAEADELQAAAAAVTAPAPAAETAEAAPEPAEDASDGLDDSLPWIETPRCTTCNECTQVSSKLFAYNENMQAYIADPDGGTYRQIVEAAEGCQVSIIHPGLPRDPNEPNLEELIERARPFN